MKRLRDLSRILVICEKPRAAERIADALDEGGKPLKRRLLGAPYYIARRDGDELIIVSALGHLYTVAQREGRWTYPIFDFTWVPVYEADRRAGERRRGFIEAIRRLSRDVEGYVSACDYDIEGSLIAYNILRHICGLESLKAARRMRFSALTRKDILKAWREMSETLDFPLIEAGRARHEVDWLFGINLSRALTLSVKRATGFYRTLSIGRVQGPTLSFLRDREIEVRTFVPRPYWIIEAEAEIAGRRLKVEYAGGRIGREADALEIERRCRGGVGVVKAVSRSMHRVQPPTLFNLGDLQREAYRVFRYSPSRTLRLAESLYLDAYISYPRTSSQKLPSTIDVREILRGLRETKYAPLAEELLSKSALRPREGKMTDPAHPAIHPTGVAPKGLRGAESKLYDLICRRFMASMGDEAVRERIRAEIDVEGYRFHLKGGRILEAGWMRFYKPYIREREVELPPLREGMPAKLVRVEAVKRFTKPPKRYNQSSLLKRMEEAEIGTKATRAEILETLYRRGYVEGDPMRMTDLGFAIVETLSRYCPEILSVEMTRRLERKLEAIQLGEAEADEVVEEAVEALKPILKRFREGEMAIGLEIDKAIRGDIIRANTLGSCPRCGRDLRIFRGRESGKRFAGCVGYFDGSCNVTYPLPQRGRIEATGKRCEVCGAPIIRVLRRGRRPWELCIDPKCPSNRR